MCFSASPVRLSPAERHRLSFLRHLSGQKFLILRSQFGSPFVCILGQGGARRRFCRPSSLLAPTANALARNNPVCASQPLFLLALCVLMNEGLFFRPRRGRPAGFNCNCTGPTQSCFGLAWLSKPTAFPLAAVVPQAPLLPRRVPGAVDPERAGEGRLPLVPHVPRAPPGTHATQHLPPQTSEHFSIICVFLFSRCQ